MHTDIIVYAECTIFWLNIDVKGKFWFVCADIAMLATTFLLQHKYLVALKNKDIHSNIYWMKI